MMMSRATLYLTCQCLTCSYHYGKEVVSNAQTTALGQDSNVQTADTGQDIGEDQMKR